MVTEGRLYGRPFFVPVFLVSNVTASTRSKLVAALWVLAGALAFSLLFASGKLTGGAIPAIQIIFIRYLSGFATVSGLVALQRRSWPAIRASQRRWLHFLRAFCGVAGGSCNIAAATLMPLADAAALALLQGMFTMLLAVLLLRERVTRGQIVAALLCLAGALVIVRGNAPSGGGMAAIFDAGLAPLLAILGAFLIACEIILIKFLTRHETALSMLLHVNGFAALLLVLPMLLLWTAAPWQQLALLALLGPMAIAGQLCNLRAYSIADAAWLAPFGYSSVAFAALIGWVMFGDVPSLAAWIGTALIVAGGLVLIRR